MEDKSGVYRIRNLVTKKIYVGSAFNFRKRWRLHRHQLNAGSHHSKKLQNSWRKHGADAFVFEVIEYVDIDKLILVEQYWIDKLDASTKGYNICAKAGNVQGIVRSNETREKIRRALTGKKKSLEHVAAMRETMTGKTHSGGPKISAALKGRKRTEAQNKRLSDAKKGVPRAAFSDEWKKNLSLSTRGIVKSEEWQRNILIGKKKAKDAREKVRLESISKIHQ